MQVDERDSRAAHFTPARHPPEAALYLNLLSFSFFFIIRATEQRAEATRARPPLPDPSRRTSNMGFISRVSEARRREARRGVIESVQLVFAGGTPFQWPLN